MSGIAFLSDLWSLEKASLISDSPSSLVYRAHREDQSVIVKILKPEGLQEVPGMDFLRWRDGKAAVMVLAQRDHAYLLEDGGTETLLDRYNVSGDRGVVFEFRKVIADLHSPSNAPMPATLVPLEVHFSALFARAENGMPLQQAPLFRWSANLARELLADQTNVRPLHGDIHHQNVVSFAGTSWKAIDPQGLIGDPAYDYANIFGNPPGKSKEVLNSDRCKYLADSFAGSPDDFGHGQDLNTSKLMKYAAVHSALSASWSLERPNSARDIENAAERLALAEILKMLLSKE